MPDSSGWVNGYKDGRGDPLYRVLMGRAYCEFVRAVFRLRLRDIDCDFRLFRRDLIQSCVSLRPAERFASRWCCCWNAAASLPLKPPCATCRDGTGVPNSSGLRRYSAP